MVKFAKYGSDVTTAAVRLARAVTGRDLVAVCDEPFFSTDDWFIGHPAMPAGIPAAIRDLTVGFRFNELSSICDLFDRHRGRIAAVVLEPATAVEPGRREIMERGGLRPPEDRVFLLSTTNGAETHALAAVGR
jgi:glutamate-1-semialdehyde 2,1-aminomutase